MSNNCTLRGKLKTIITYKCSSSYKSVICFDKVTIAYISANDYNFVISILHNIFYTYYKVTYIALTFLSIALQSPLKNICNIRIYVSLYDLLT